MSRLSSLLPEAQARRAVWHHDDTSGIWRSGRSIPVAGLCRASLAHAVSPVCSRHSEVRLGLNDVDQDLPFYPTGFGARPTDQVVHHLHGAAKLAGRMCEQGSGMDVASDDQIGAFQDEGPHRRSKSPSRATRCERIALGAHTLGLQASSDGEVGPRRVRDQCGLNAGTDAFIFGQDHGWCTRQ